MRSTGGDDQGVVIQCAIAEDDAAVCGVNVDGFAQQHLRVFLFAQNLAQRAGDVRGGKRAGGDLVKQRLKKMIIAAVNQGHLDGAIFQRLRGGESAETAANDYDFVCLSHSSANSLALAREAEKAA